ncbi:MAG: helix-turn-helix transcriptional regulator [Chloroflexota bacterium]
MSKAGSKYYPLYLYLSEQQEEYVSLTMADIEALLGRELPKTAKNDRGWWGNRNSGPSHAKAWMSAKYEVTHIDMNTQTITFRRPKLVYIVSTNKNGEPQWDGSLVEGLRRHMGLTQGALAEELGVRQQTISEWEKGTYLPSRATSKYLSMVAERVDFVYQVKGQST